jgi:hypothetical protein
MARPRVTLKCPADSYANQTCERIVEFFDPTTKKGGLISFYSRADGTLAVDVYRCDAGVVVNGKPATVD